jgi:hypothetical protein
MSLTMLKKPYYLSGIFWHFPLSTCGRNRKSVGMTDHDFSLNAIFPAQLPALPSANVFWQSSAVASCSL